VFSLVLLTLSQRVFDVQQHTVYPTTGDAKRASEAVDDIINNVNLIDELNVSIMLRVLSFKTSLVFVE
jgi:hypothetical protein